MLLINHTRDLSVFNIKTFRDLLEKWERNKETGNIRRTLERIESSYRKYRESSKERLRWIEYVRISSYIQDGYKKMNAYSLASPNEKINTVEQRFIRQKMRAKELGYNVNDPKHIEKIKEKWDIQVSWDMVL